MAIATGAAAPCHNRGWPVVAADQGVAAETQQRVGVRG